MPESLVGKPCEVVRIPVRGNRGTPMVASGARHPGALMIPPTTPSSPGRRHCRSVSPVANRSPARMGCHRMRACPIGLVTDRAAARISGVSREMLRLWIETGAWPLPRAILATTLYFMRSDVEGWLRTGIWPAEARFRGRSTGDEPRHENQMMRTWRRAACPGGSASLATPGWSGIGSAVSGTRPSVVSTSSPGGKRHRSISQQGRIMRELKLIGRDISADGKVDRHGLENLRSVPPRVVWTLRTA
jgi:hypothetical protein